MTVLQEKRTRINRENLDLREAYAEPTDELEKLISAVFGEVFDVDRIGANDEFFDLGGDSLLAETLSMLIWERNGSDFPISQLVVHSSPRKIAAFLKGKGGPSTTQERERPPFFMVPGRDGFMLLKPDFYDAMPKGQKVHMFELPGMRGGRAFDRLEDIAAEYVKELNEAYPEGPILLAAFCMGGLVAVEMAYQLAKSGRAIHHLVLFDPGIPASVVINHQRRSGKCRSDEIWGPFAEAVNVSAVGMRRRSREVLWQVVCLLLLGRRTDGCGDEDFSDDRLRHIRELIFRWRFWRRRDQHRHKRAVARLPIRARAKLRAAYWHYKPHTFEGPVTILTARLRHESFRDEEHVWARILPNRRLYFVSERHSDLTDIDAPKSGRIMVSVFDEALGEMGSATSQAVGE